MINEIRQIYDQIPKIPDVPKVYDLIESHAGLEHLASQIFQDFYSGSVQDGREKVYLGLHHLLLKGVEGEAVLQYMAQDSGDLGGICRQLVENPRISPEELEKLLCIDRFKNTIYYTNPKEYIEKVYAAAIAHGIIPSGMEIREFFETYYSHDNMTAGLSGGVTTHENNMVDQEIIPVSSTFGLDEPTYLELLGPEEILRLRKKKEPNFLLLGSLGAYSAREFSSYVTKINPSSRAHVIELFARNQYLLEASKTIPNLHLVQGDILKLPYAEGCMEHAYTSQLFNSLIVNGEIPGRNAGVTELFKQVFLVLAPGGSLVMKECPSERFKDSIELYESGVKLLTSIALKAGFQSPVIERLNLRYTFRPQLGSVQIDENGFPHYQGATLEFGSQEHNTTLNLRFIKPQKV